MEILCACDDSYVPHTATMLCSLLTNNHVHCIHLFHSPIPLGKLQDLKAFVQKFDTDIACYEMTVERFHGLRVDPKSSSSLANYYRLAAARILPSTLKKILYLDSDIIVRRSINDLWNIDVHNYALAAIPDSVWSPDKNYVKLPADAKYFNSGVMLINLVYWRENKIYENSVKFVQDNPEKANYFDQDALNAILINRWMSVSPTWNAHDLDRGRSLADPAIVHFIGPKPWQWPVVHAFKYEYRRYRRKTPWPRYMPKCRQLDLGQIAYRRLQWFAHTVLPARVRLSLRSRLRSARG